jgi:hypothetical protein
MQCMGPRLRGSDGVVACMFHAMAPALPCQKFYGSMGDLE